MRCARRVAISALFCNFFLYSSSFELWTLGAITKEVDRHISYNIDEGFRFRENHGFFYNYTESELALHVGNETEELSFGFGYRFGFQNIEQEREIEQEEGKEKKTEKCGYKWYTEFRPIVNLYLQKIKNRSAFLYRLRVECLDRRCLESRSRFRNKLTLEVFLKNSEPVVSSYVSGEVFYSFENKEVNQGRIYVGFVAQLKDCLEFGVHYLWKRLKKEGTFKTIRVAGLSMHVLL